jgi:hypothetical protein
LQVGLAIVNKNISHLRNQAKNAPSKNTSMKDYQKNMQNGWLDRMQHAFWKMSIKCILNLPITYLMLLHLLKLYNFGDNFSINR